MNYLLHLLIYLSIYVIIALSLNLVVGYCGLLTLAHAAFFAVGSYTYALISLKFGLGFLPSMALGVAVSLILSLSISLSAWRFKDDFFVMASLAAQSLLLGLFNNLSQQGVEPGTWPNLTNGPFGLTNIPKPVIFGIKFDTIGSMFILSAILAALCATLLWILLSSPWARLLKAMRDDELVARGLGKNTRLAKVQSFAISCGMAAIAGSIYAAYVSYIDPSIASLDESVLMLCMVLVGGTGNFKGALIGAFTLLIIPEFLRLISLPDTYASNVRLLVFGLLLVALVHLRPQGIAGEYRIE